MGILCPLMEYLYGASLGFVHRFIGTAYDFFMHKTYEALVYFIGKHPITSPELQYFIYRKSITFILKISTCFFKFRPINVI
jgi:hypothetical protein